MLDFLKVWSYIWAYFPLKDIHECDDKLSLFVSTKNNGQEFEWQKKSQAVQGVLTNELHSCDIFVDKDHKASWHMTQVHFW